MSRGGAEMKENDQQAVGLQTKSLASWGGGGGGADRGGNARRFGFC